MPFYHILILALIQGLTEFLPVSSSGHLLVTHAALGNNVQDLCWDQNRLMDVAVHVGTLISVLLYFNKDLRNMFCGLLNKNRDGLQLFLNVAIASIPVVIAGFIINKNQPSFICMIEVMAWTTLGFGIVLWISDRFADQKSLKEMTGGHAFLIGLFQTLALIPGVSRSGITMTGASFLGFSRSEAARFSMLLSIIAISGAGALSSYHMIGTEQISLSNEILMAVGLSAVAGWIAIALMMKWLSFATFKPFAIYRIILGLFLLAIIYNSTLQDWGLPVDMLPIDIFVSP